MQTTAIPKNHMDIPWHEYSGHGNCPITEADLTEKASIVGRVGLMLLSCGTGAWRVRSSMNTISQSRETVSDDALSVCSGQSFQVLPRKKQTAFPRVLRQAKM